MVMVNINKKLYKKISKLIKKEYLDYPTIKYFVEKSIQSEINKFEKSIKKEKTETSHKIFSNEAKKLLYEIAQKKQRIQKDHKSFNVSPFISPKKIKIMEINKIKIIGVGNAGNNMVSWLYKDIIPKVKTINIDTDQRNLESSCSNERVLIGREITSGLGTEGNPNIGRDAAIESIQQIKEAVGSPDIMFICAGLGGGTGGGSSPVIAKIGKKNNTLVVGVISLPFNIEGEKINNNAKKSLDKLNQICDSVIVIDNNTLINFSPDIRPDNGFNVINELVSTTIKSLVEGITLPCLVGLDFADIKTVLSKGGISTIAIGISNRINDVTEKVFSNVFLYTDFKKANGALMSIEGGEKMSLENVLEIVDRSIEKLNPDANVIWSAKINEDMNDKIIVKTILTGLKVSK